MSAWRHFPLAGPDRRRRGGRAVWCSGRTGDNRHHFALASATNRSSPARRRSPSRKAWSTSTPLRARPADGRHLLAHAAGCRCDSPEAMTEPGNAGCTRTTASRCSPRRSSRPPASSSGSTWPRRSLSRWPWPMPRMGQRRRGVAVSSNVDGGRPRGVLPVSCSGRRLYLQKMHNTAVKRADFPGLAGVVPGFEVHRPGPTNSGLGLELFATPIAALDQIGELRSAATSPQARQARFFLWVDPVADLALRRAD